MIYLKSFRLLDELDEHYASDNIRRVNNSIYPFHLFTSKQFLNINFSDITCFYGGNGSGKTTILNIIAEKIKANRQEVINKGDYFNTYVAGCNYEMDLKNVFDEAKMITSDDVFDSLINIRAINSHINRKKDELGKAYLEYAYHDNDYAINNYEDIKNSVDAHKQSMSQYIRTRLTNNNIIEQSNGESALLFWEREIKENALYILDEPENSLSAENQLKLKKFIEESVRFYNCQFIISTHSPFFLNLENALIYDLDSNPVVRKKWTELPNIRTYYKFFKEHEEEFNQNLDS